MQIKTTIRYHLSLVRMATIKKSTSDKCWKGCGEKEILLQCWWESKLIYSLWRTVWRFLKKKGGWNKATTWLSNFITGHIPWENHNSKRHMYPNVHCSTIYNIIARTQKQPRCLLIYECIKKIRYIYTMEYYSAIKKNKLESVLVRWMNLRVCYTEWQKSEREKLISHINRYTWNPEHSTD